MVQEKRFATQYSYTKKNGVMRDTQEDKESDRNAYGIVSHARGIEMKAVHRFKENTLRRNEERERARNGGPSSTQKRAQDIWKDICTTPQRTSDKSTGAYRYKIAQHYPVPFQEYSLFSIFAQYCTLSLGRTP